MKITRIIRLLGVFLAFCLISTSFNSQCESIGIGGTHYQIIMTLPLNGESPSYWETSALDGTIIDQDFDGNQNHFAFNPDLYSNIITCISFEETVCCVEYFYEEDNGWVIYSPPPCDTIYTTVIEYLTDTIIEYVDIELIITDTLYITDTIVEYIDIIIDNYIYITDTITEFVSITTYIDCETGEECGALTLCDETSIFAPNTVTPNGDGWNDTWQVIADESCWDQWEIRIYNRWGELVWVSTSSTDEWDGNVAAGVYVYTIVAYSSINNDVFEFNGTISVFY